MRKHALACDYYKRGPGYCNCASLFFAATDHLVKKPRKKKRRDPPQREGS